MNEDQQKYMKELYAKAYELSHKISLMIANQNNTIQEVSLACSILAVLTAKSLEAERKDFLNMIDDLWDNLKEVRK